MSWAQLKKSLEVAYNFKHLKEISDIADLNKFGTIYITQDGLLSLDLITTAQKLRLTRGGGLLRLCKRWKDAQLQTEDANLTSNTLLPAIVGLHSIELAPKRFINILVKLNTIRFDFPLSERVWENNPAWYPKFVKKNIIGWVTITPDSVTKRFMANSVIDGKFSIELTVKFKTIHNS